MLFVLFCSVSYTDRACVLYHALSSSWLSIDWGTLRGVAVAEAVAAYDHVVEGVVVLLCHLIAGVEQVVTQRVKLSELHPQVCDLQHVCAQNTHTHTQLVTRENCEHGAH